MDDYEELQWITLAWYTCHDRCTNAMLGSALKITSFGWKTSMPRLFSGLVWTPTLPQEGHPSQSVSYLLLSPFSCLPRLQGHQTLRRMLSRDDPHEGIQQAGQGPQDLHGDAPNTEELPDKDMLCSTNKCGKLATDIGRRQRTSIGIAAIAIALVLWK